MRSAPKSHFFCMGGGGGVVTHFLLFLRHAPHELGFNGERAVTLCPQHFQGSGVEKLSAGLNFLPSLLFGVSAIFAGASSVRVSIVTHPPRCRVLSKMVFTTPQETLSYIPFVAMQWPYIPFNPWISALGMVDTILDFCPLA